MSMQKKIENLTKKYLSPPGARVLKRLAIYPRYAAQVRACRAGFRQFGHMYPQKILFIAGLPKSGSTWLEKMVSSCPGFHELLIPEANIYDLTAGGCHDFDLPSDTFSRFTNMLVATKMHVHGSPHNVELLHSAGVKYVILYRDLRDVAVSYFFYVRQTPWHPEYPIYAGLSVPKGLEIFADRTLLAYVDWVRSWHKNRSPKMSVELRYEEILLDAVSAMTRVFELFELDTSPDTVKEIVETHSFRRLSGGRSQGQENKSSFFRKGMSGDWKNHFTPDLKELYKELIGDFLIEFGYEQSYSW